ncbi:hypothetical protein ACQ4LK_26060, partial [Bacillus pumilus]
EGLVGSEDVYKRQLHLKSNQDIHTKAILERLARHNTTGYTFAANVADPKSPQKRTCLLSHLRAHETL